MKERKITDPTKARAAIAQLMAEGWKFDLNEIHRKIPGGLKDSDWLKIANGCLEEIMSVLDSHKIIPLARFIQ